MSINSGRRIVGIAILTIGLVLGGMVTVAVAGPLSQLIAFLSK